EEGKWLLRYYLETQHSQYNHGPSLKASVYPSYYRLTQPIIDTVNIISRQVSI
ncbi:hypothetical protein LZ31DRAFT_483952, partial [Colletotrichum somersetense]